MSSRSHPAVHPLDVEIPQLTDGQPDDRVRMKDIPGTPAKLALRLFQFGFAAVSVAVMAATTDFPSVTAFRYLVAALSLQCLWSFSLAMIDVYALLVKRSLRNPRILALFTIGDGDLTQNVDDADYVNSYICCSMCISWYNRSHR